MSNYTLLGVILLSVLVVHQFHWAQCDLLEDILMENDEDEVAIKSLNCFREYLAFHFMGMSKARLHVIQEPTLRRSRIETLFLQKSNELFYNPISLLSLTLLDGKRKDFLIFLSPEDLGKFDDISLPHVHDESFLYVFFEQNESNTSLADIYSIFTPIFEQHVVVIMTSRNESAGLHVWNAYRVVLRRCQNVKTFDTIKLSQCGGVDDFNAIPLTPAANSKSCPIQVGGRNDPPFALYDPVRGFHNGIEYRLVRLISERSRVPIEFTFFNFSTAKLISKELALLKKATHLKDSEYFWQGKIV